MAIAQCATYLADICETLKKHWPENRTVNIVCHGHSVPSGYFATPYVDTFNAYPHLLHIGLKQRFPYAVINVIVTAIGGEHSQAGAARFSKDVLCHQPDVITIDYGLNDRGLGLEKARTAWSEMIKLAVESGAKIVLLTPTADITLAPSSKSTQTCPLTAHAEQIRQLCIENEIGLVDSFSACQEYLKTGDLSDILSADNHPNRLCHELVTKELLRWFPIASLNR